MATKIQLRRDTSSSWSSINPVLSQGEPGIESNTGMMKLGNGTSAWNCLQYLVTCASQGVTWENLGNKNNSCGPESIALGREAGFTGQSCCTVAIGAYAGFQNQCYGSVAIGVCAGQNGQCENSVAIGLYAASNLQSCGSTAIGYSAGYTRQGTYSVAVGYSAASGSYQFREYVDNCGSQLVLNSTCGVFAGMRVIGCGFDDGQQVNTVVNCTTVELTAPPCSTPAGNLQFLSNQGYAAVAIGRLAGDQSQGSSAIAIGNYAGANWQVCRGIAIGCSAGGNQQLANGIAIGTCAGYCLQGSSSVAIGHNAGKTHQGNVAVAVGHLAGFSGQVDNSIAINATACQLNPANSGLYIDPVRSCVCNVADTVYYNTITKEVTYGPSGSGGLIIPIPVQCAVGTPTVTITCTAGFGPDQATVSISVVSYAPVISAGVVITAGACVATPVVAGTSSTGCQTVTIAVPGTDAPFTAYAYVQTPFTTVFSAPVSGTSGICFLKGTMIALSDGTYKAIEDITYNDLLLVWDFDLGRYAEARPVWIKAVETEAKYNLLTFSDGSTLRTIGNHHIFNKEANRFTHTMRDDTPIGTKTVNEHGRELTLVSAEEIHETCESYNVFTEYHLNMYADGILTSNRFNNTYPIENMQFVKDDRKLRSVSEFTGIDQRWIDGLRLREQTVEHSAEYIRWYMQRLEHYDVHSVVYQ